MNTEHERIRLEALTGLRIQHTLDSRVRVVAQDIVLAIVPNLIQAVRFLQGIAASKKASKWKTI